MQTYHSKISYDPRRKHMGVQRLNHAVLYVADVHRSVEFYTEQLGFVVVNTIGDRAAFLRAENSPNDHDLGLFGVGSGHAQRGVGLYHLAWQVDTIEQLAAVRTRLLAAGSMVGESDHGVSKSVYAKDPDGIEFEVMWAVPREFMHGVTAGVAPLDLDAELDRWTATRTLHEQNVDAP